MHILVLGASSFVGTALAQAFSPNNTLTLVGRNVDKLATATNKCKHSGAAQVKYVEQDFCSGVNSVLQAIEGRHIDLIVDAASASASPNKRDSAIGSSDISPLVSADFLSRTQIVDHILHSQDTAPAVIFISTVLVLVKSPGRTVYTALKGLYETYLNKLRDEHSDLYLLVVYVGTVIDTKNESTKPGKLASAVVKAFDRRKRKLFYGLSGVLFLVLFYFQPVVFYGVTVAQRQIRKLLD